MNQLKTKKYWRNLALAVIVAVAITVFLTSQIVNVTQANIGSSNDENYSPGAHTINVLTGPISLNPPKGYYFTGFYVPDNAKNPVLQGNFTVVNNSGNYSGATLTIWSQQQFINYLNGHNATPCYNKDMFPMTSGAINIILSSGPYFILINSATINATILQAQVSLNFTV